MYVPVVAPYRELVPLAVVDSGLFRAHFGPSAAVAQIQVHVQPAVDHLDGVHAGLRKRYGVLVFILLRLFY